MADVVTGRGEGGPILGPGRQSSPDPQESGGPKRSDSRLNCGDDRRSRLTISANETTIPQAGQAHNRKCSRGTYKLDLITSRKQNRGATLDILQGFSLLQMKVLFRHAIRNQGLKVSKQGYAIIITCKCHES